MSVAWLSLPLILNCMRIIEITYRKPANLLIDALQKHCKMLLADTASHGIHSLKDLEDRLWSFAEQQQAYFPKCSMDRLDVISHSNAVHEWYHLLYMGEKSMIQVSARPDTFEKAFREYDAGQSSTEL
jgi:hypothetical protein